MQLPGLSPAPPAPVACSCALCLPALTLSDMLNCPPPRCKSILHGLIRPTPPHTNTPTPLSASAPRIPAPAPHNASGRSRNEAPASARTCTAIAFLAMAPTALAHTSSHSTSRRSADRSASDRCACTRRWSRGSCNRLPATNCNLCMKRGDIMFPRVTNSRSRLVCHLNARAAFIQSTLRTQLLYLHQYHKLPQKAEMIRTVNTTCAYEPRERGSFQITCRLAIRDRRLPATPPPPARKLTASDHPERLRSHTHMRTGTRTLCSIPAFSSAPTEPIAAAAPAAAPRAPP
eukprot:1041511-Pleurochrysis_carterae.AAC.1